MTWKNTDMRGSSAKRNLLCTLAQNFSKFMHLTFISLICHKCDPYNKTNALIKNSSQENILLPGEITNIVI